MKLKSIKPLAWLLILSLCLAGISGTSAKFVTATSTYTINLRSTNGSYEFTYTGSVARLAIPFNGYYAIRAAGAGGGIGYRANGTTSEGLRGLAGYVEGYVYLTTSDTLYIYVGQQGKNGTGSGNVGGWGGGTSANGGNGDSSGNRGGGGGGATKVVLNNSAVPGGAYGSANATAFLNSAIFVAGGGGGGGGRGGLLAINGINGGNANSVKANGSGSNLGADGSRGVDRDTGKTSDTSAYGGGWSNSGATDQGGNIGSASSSGAQRGGPGFGGNAAGGSTQRGGGGGGGYFGGGGAGGGSTNPAGAGGGGSSFIRGVVNGFPTKSLTHVSASLLSNTTFTVPQTGHSGDGSCIITYLGNVDPETLYKR